MNDDQWYDLISDVHAESPEGRRGSRYALAKRLAEMEERLTNMESRLKEIERTPAGNGQRGNALLVKS